MELEAAKILLCLLDSATFPPNHERGNCKSEEGCVDIVSETLSTTISDND